MSFPTNPMQMLQQLPGSPSMPEDFTNIPTHGLTINDLMQVSSFDHAVRRVAAQYNFQNHPYLRWMQQASTSRKAFCQSQIPFRFAVESFSQALAAVLARMPLLEERLPLANNVAEEHGYGDRLRSHKFTFHQYLKALGATPEELKAPCPVPVLAFNQSLLTYTLTQSGTAGAALLGMIEYLYVDISAAIAHTLHHRQWTEPDSQSHYAAHEKLDVEHAQELLTLAQPCWQEAQVAQGLLLGAFYFWRLYDDLLQSHDS